MNKKIFQAFKAPLQNNHLLNKISKKKSQQLIYKGTHQDKNGFLIELGTNLFFTEAICFPTTMRQQTSFSKKANMSASQVTL